MFTQIEQETYSAVKQAARTYLKKNDEIDWEQRRYEIAKDCLAKMTPFFDEKEECVNASIEYADLLIEALRKKV